MDIGLMFANTGTFTSAEGAAALGAAAEAAGLESLWAVEHVVVPVGYESAYPYASSGRMPGEGMPIPDPLIWLSYLAAHTSTVRLATGILILPQRNPVVVAKSTATLDVLSGGRLMLGVGVGWLREEFDALGMPFERRGARTDEYVAALRTLWTEPEPTFDGEFVRFEGARMEPKPAQGSIPVVIGGHTEAAAARAGRIGDGFFPARAEDLGQLVAVMRESAEKAGRDPDAIELTMGAPRDQAQAEEYVSLGVSRFIVVPPTYALDGIEEALGGLVAAVRSTVG